MTRPVYRWAILFRSESRLDGKKAKVGWDRGEPLLFHTRSSARKAIAERYGYLRHRPDLRREPHGWRMPAAVKVRVLIEPIRDPWEDA